MRPWLRRTIVPALLALAVACGDTHSSPVDAGAGDATTRDVRERRTTKLHAATGPRTTQPEAAQAPAALRIAVTRQRQTARGYDFVAGPSGALGSHAGKVRDGTTVTATPDGVRVSTRPAFASGASRGALALGVHTVSVGRPGAPVSRHVLEQHADGQELVLTREDGVEERYMAGPLGVEQSFAIERAPGGSGAVVIDVAFDGLVPAAVDGCSDRVVLHDAEGRPLGGYRDLVAVDATSRELPSHMELQGGDVRLAIDDTGATYPLSVDPVVWTQQQELTAADGAASDAFGTSVAISGTLAIVGAPDHAAGAKSGAGAAYVFSQSGTSWTLQQELTAQDGAAFDAFGTSVAITAATPVDNGGPPGVSPGIAVVGSPYHTVGTHTESGAAYVFVQSGTTWALQQEVSAGDGAAFDGFGTSVSVSGSTAFVGSPFHTASGHSEAGAAYVFSQSGTTWNQQEELTASDGKLGDLFGFAVSVSGLYAIVGAYQHDVGGTTSAGAAYLFTLAGASWTQEQELTAADKGPSDFFGYSVSVSGSTELTGPLAAGATAIVGAYQHNVGTVVSAGAAYVYATPAGAAPNVWTLRQELTAGDGASGDWFGFSVAADASTIAVGAPNHAVVGKAGAGSSYGFTESGTTWTETQELTASDGAASDALGSSVATSSDVILSGAPSHEVGTSAGAGAAYVWDGTLSDNANCYINDAIVANAGVNPANSCQVCDISTLTSGWSSAPSSSIAPPNGTACTYGDGGAGVCNAGTCEIGCFIAGTFYAPGTVNPANACETCTPLTSTTAWSSGSNGASCGASGCSTAGVCTAGVCTGSTSTCSAEDQCHTAGVCNASTGTCSSPTDPDGTTCNDGNACTQTDTCQAGVCTGSNPVTCAPLDQCHAAGTCDPTSGVCSNPADPNGTTCNDGNACTTMDTCELGVCAGQPVVCMPEDECHVAGTCDPTSGSCSSPDKPDGTVCSVGTCKSGVCTPTIVTTDAGVKDGSAEDGASRDGSPPLDGGDASKRTDGEALDATHPEEGGSSDAQADGTRDSGDAEAHTDAHLSHDASEHDGAAEQDASDHHDASGRHDAGERDGAAGADGGDGGSYLVASGGGCSCRVTRTGVPAGPRVLAFALVSLALVARRRRRAVAR